MEITDLNDGHKLAAFIGILDSSNENCERTRSQYASSPESEYLCASAFWLLTTEPEKNKAPALPKN